ncbi:MAG: type II toxin-antitoxin system VapC family toxin [Candidatus Daviesbacteria bacterium]|nr:type II toxin-antitoxin system VapC family toxin [Candidatus Daviesbacteria bacterium]
MAETIVIDASVVAKWLLPDEQDSAAADRIKEDLIERTLLIAVPVFIFYEVNNLLKSAALSKRIDPKKAAEAYEGCLNLELSVYSSKETLKHVLDKAFELDISSYDASYVALAEYLQVTFYTADEKLVKKSKSKWVKNLEEYLENLKT